jgi:hypothetical protein
VVGSPTRSTPISQRWASNGRAPGKHRNGRTINAAGPIEGLSPNYSVPVAASSAADLTWQSPD